MEALCGAGSPLILHQPVIHVHKDQAFTVLGSPQCAPCGAPLNAHSEAICKISETTFATGFLCICRSANMTEGLDPEVAIPRNITTRPSAFPSVLQNFVRSVQSGSFEDSIGVRVRQRSKRVCSELCGYLLLSMVASGPTCSSSLPCFRAARPHRMLCLVLLAWQFA